jgi:hypothetical protein
MAYSEIEINDIAADIKSFAKTRWEAEKPVNLSRYCVERDIPRITIYSWRDRKVKVILEALAFLKECQRGDLIEGGLQNRYNNKTTTLLLQSNHGMTDRSTLQGDPENPLGINYKHDPAKAAEEIIAAQSKGDG